MTAYRGPVRSMIVEYKDRGRSGLAAPLARALASVITEGVLPEAAVRGGVLLIPVPSARRSVRRRGGDTMLGLARLAAAELRSQGIDAAALGVLRRMPGTPDQGDLGGAQRRTNLNGALRATGAVSGTVIVVDDVTTTGASVAAAWSALTSAGAHVVGAATVAAARLDTDKP
ncbi:hypothetical protein GCM10010468_76620 [Actinocorallia longicatena]|uniref:Phosphoribosyltransferase domain-containing protein n=2 Tax=Actinocorallia longicatena TaxID=111803 RepID=A0ABP6QT34_9ACTN